MPTEKKSGDSDTFNTVLGFIVIFALGWALFIGIRALVHWLKPPPPPILLFLSAQLIPETAAATEAFLQIQGQASQGGEPLANNLAKIRIEAPGEDFSQTLMVGITNGNFLVVGRPQPNLWFSTGQNLILTVEIAEVKNGGAAASEIVYVNMQKPLLKLSTLWLGVFFTIATLVFIFLKTFVGPKTEQKNRWAIIFSYVVILIFLALPLVVPIAMPYLFPNMIQLMIRRPTPVGLVVTRVDDRKNPEPQWALNIGGFVTAVTNDLSQSRAQGSNGATAALEYPIQSAEVVREVVVHGGLTIPLYVIILSILGGAINMTRKVPTYQSGMETEENEAGKKHNLLSMVMPNNWKSVVTQGTQDLVSLFSSKPKEPDLANTESNVLSPAQQPKAAENPELKEESEDPTENWRKGLLSQYMSLISAPFLAIVMFYLLSWLDLQRVSVLVIVSFSIGLMSDKIIDRITETSANLLTNKNEVQK